MAQIKKYQNNFTAGAISPAMYARTDITKYASGCKTIVNGIVHAYGGLSKRPGTRYIDTLPGPGLLFPFTYSVVQSYVLCMYDPDLSGASDRKAKMRVYKNGGAVMSGAAVFEMETPYLPSELSSLRFVQSADTMFIVHPSHPPMKLVRHSHTDWVFSEIQFYPDIDAPTGLTATPSGFVDPSGTYVVTSCSYKVSAVTSREMESMPSASAWAATLSTWPSGAKVVLNWNAVPGADHYEVYKDERGYYAWLGSADTNTFTDNCITGDSGTGPKENRDPFNPPATPAGTAVTGTAGSNTLELRASALNSAGAESAASAVVTALVNKQNATFTCNTVSGASSYWFYFKYETESTWHYVTAAAPSSGSQVRVVCSDPEDSDEGTPMDSPNTYPGAVGIYQQRLIFARSNREPQTVWMSESGAFDSMAVANPLRDDSAITATVDSRQMNEIRHFIPLRDVLMMTSGAEFVLSAGSNQDAVTPTALQFKLQSYFGVSEVPPVVSGVNIIFAENSGRVVRDLKYSLTDDGYTGEDVSLLAEHLLSSPIVDWSYQQDPWSTIYICLENGKMLTFTYMRDQEIYAWAEQESSGGSFLSCCCIRENSEDNAYFLTLRDGSYFMEFQVRRRYGDAVEESFFVDCGLDYHDSTTAISHVTGLEHLSGKAVVALADGSVVRNLTVSEEGTVDLPNAAKDIAIGLPYEMKVEILDPEITSQGGSTIGLTKNISDVAVMLRESRGLSVGPSFDKLTVVKFPSPAKYGDPPPLYSGILKLAIPGSHRTEATVCMEHDDPLPFTVLSIDCNISVG